MSRCDVPCRYVHCVLGMYPRCPVCGGSCDCDGCKSAYLAANEPDLYFTTKPPPRVADLGDGLYSVELSSEEVSTLGTVTIPLGFDPGDY